MFFMAHRDKNRTKKSMICVAVYQDEVRYILGLRKIFMTARVLVINLIHPKLYG